MKSEGFFETRLLDWFEKYARTHLPWRKTSLSAYEVWVSEIMLQQTQVSRVVDYYTRFVERFPTIFDLAKASWEDFYPYYAGLGYYNRGRNMLRCAQTVVEKYNGVFPADKKLLMALPGIGSYTASAILSFAYEKNEIAVDTNVKKLFGRYFFGSKDAVVDFEALGKALRANKKDLNAAVMDFSSRVCLKIPRCGECPLQKHCVYYETDGQKEVVKQKKKSDFPTTEASVYVVLHKNHKEYFSKNKKQYQPFLLSKKYNSRAGIKAYFLRVYGLTLSVRPPHKKGYLKGKPVMLVNAQILLGTHQFVSFSKKQYESKSFSKKIQ